jgi:hypothetical protein
VCQAIRDGMRQRLQIGAGDIAGDEHRLVTSSKRDDLHAVDHRGQAATLASAPVTSTETSFPSYWSTTWANRRPP